MSLRCLDRKLRAYRIGHPHGDYPIFDAAGSTLYPERWNDPDTPVIYAAEHYSTAILEKLAHGAGLMPPNQHFTEITLPQRWSFEGVIDDRLPGWDSVVPGVSRRFGVDWVRGNRSAILLVPSLGGSH